MATKLKNPKAKAIQELQGLSVIVFIKEASIIESNNLVGKGVAGYIVKVDDAFVYMGADMSEFDTMIEIDDIGVIRIPDDIQQILNMVGGVIPEHGSEDIQ